MSKKRKKKSNKKKQNNVKPVNTKQNNTKKVDIKQTDTKQKNIKKNASSLDTLKKVLSVIGKYKILLGISIVLAMVTVVLQLYIPILFGDAIDGIVSKGHVDFEMIKGVLAKTLVLIIITSAATWIMNAINNRLAYRVVQDIRAKAIRQIERLPLSYLDSHSTGDVVGRVIADTDQLSDGFYLDFHSCSAEL